MHLDREFVLTAVKRLAGYHLELVGADVVEDLLSGSHEAVSLEGGSNLDIDASYKTVLESVHFLILAASTVMEGGRLLREYALDKTHREPVINEVLDTLQKRFDGLDPEAKEATLAEIRRRFSVPE
jgi:hypothetical protein